MHRAPVMNLLQRQILSHRSKIPTPNRVAQPCDVFINHRGIDTKRTIASLLYDHLTYLNLRPFLDNKTMKPGDKLFDKIDSAIRGCKIGITVFSPNYCDSYFCLHELALITESKKKIIPIFCDVKPSELRVVDNGSVPSKELERFNSALEEAKYTVGLAFDSLKGNWADVVTNAAGIVIDSLIEVEEEERNRHQNTGSSLQNVTEAAQIIEE
ncbi:Toll-Interleukin-Resistance (TIR) domain family protein [Actinidia rufa]|uniref:Toll-Interleukin-Resistance (TIR) domain family protein n=2 Tax=Actinidia rufa TaxID=165716 RepID=A0A7J0DGA1_9ERIC|nr:Toll-Interleukin-Resistance (TIR) domain family protein [Actinidia rufa]